jgi:hypothetical protein
MAKHFEYERPTITEIGTLNALTLQGKFFGSDDGFTVQGQSIGNTGVSLILPN